MKKSACIYVAGAEGVIGAALARTLVRRGYTRVLCAAGGGPDLAEGAAVEKFFARARPEYVFHTGGRTAGVGGNVRFPADLALENLLAAANVLAAAQRSGVRKLLYLAGSCAYPRDCPQPMREEYLMTGPLEPTSEAYATAKIAGLRLAQAMRRQHGAPFIAGIAPNTFGPGDDFSPENSHVAAALVRRFHEARLAGRASVTVWGTGRPRREFLFADDLADACIFVMKHYDGAEPINLGGGTDLAVADLAEMVRAVVGFRGRIRFDPRRPDGAPAKVLDSSRLRRMGWRPRTPLRRALEVTYAWYCRAAADGQAEGGGGAPGSGARIDPRLTAGASHRASREAPGPTSPRRKPGAASRRRRRGGA
ncbi:MAG: GDP-L-fucose synthase [Planctomycetes bacterium]|nr:GDP-L-fucose synthase [Planctomycetota bacterium]